MGAVNEKENYVKVIGEAETEGEEEEEDLQNINKAIDYVDNEKQLYTYDDTPNLTESSNSSDEENVGKKSGSRTPTKMPSYSKMPAVMHVKFGTVCSIKTTGIVLESYDLSRSRTPHLVFKPEIDTRDAGKNVLKARIGGKVKCCGLSIHDNIYDMIKVLDKEEKPLVIYIDECQFLTEDQANQLRDIVDDFEIRVVVCGLKTDFMGKMWPTSIRFTEIGDVVETLESFCPCGSIALYNARIDKNLNIVKKGQLIDIGHHYQKLCSKCFKRDNVKHFVSDDSVSVYQRLQAKFYNIKLV